MSKINRPRSITIISILILIMGIGFVLFHDGLLYRISNFPILFQSYLARKGISVAIALFFECSYAFILVISAIGILIGYNWARWLYIVYGGLFVISRWYVYKALYVGELSAEDHLLSFGIWLVLVYYFTRSDASAFFGSRKIKG